jgi:hypothetical protein
VRFIATQKSWRFSKESATNVGLQDPTLQFDPRENLLIKGQSIPALHANGGSQSAHAPS